MWAFALKRTGLFAASPHYAMLHTFILPMYSSLRSGLSASIPNAATLIQVTIKLKHYHLIYQDTMIAFKLKSKLLA